MLRRRWDLADRGFGSAAVAEAGDPPDLKARPTEGGAPASVPVVAVRCNACAGIPERDTAIRRKRRPLVVTAYVML